MPFRARQDLASLQVACWYSAWDEATMPGQPCCKAASRKTSSAWLATCCSTYCYQLPRLTSSLWPFTGAKWYSLNPKAVRTEKV